MDEKAFETRLIDAFKRAGWYARHLDVPGHDGWPDVIAIKGGDFRFVECKANTTKLRPSQVAFHKVLEREYGVRVWVAAWFPTHIAVGKDEFAEVEDIRQAVEVILGA